ncbi:MAG: hypothetical protein COA84_13345 [Robiginitomaculum sp.]|nr:MAG: hypothetical protein COA84_13345 [Robiginitomaculum sp.]
MSNRPEDVISIDYSGFDAIVKSKQQAERDDAFTNILYNDANNTHMKFRTDVEPADFSDPATKPRNTGDWQKSDTGAMRQALGVPYFRQVPLEAIAAGATALEYGAKKYADRNWEKGLPWQQMIDSLKRHIDDFERRNDIDDGPDGSDLHQICMIMASAMMLSASVMRGVGHDDRMPATPEIAFTSKQCGGWMKNQLDGARTIVPKDKRS